MESKKTTTTVAFEKEPPAGPLGSFSIFTIALGTVLGGGIITLLPTGIATGGTIAGLMFPICVLIGTLYLLPYIIATRVVRLGGGAVSLIGGLHQGKRTVLVGMYAMISIFSMLSLSTYGLSLANYVKAEFTNSNTILVAAICVTVFYVLHLFGVKTLSKIQNFMMPIVIAGLLLFIICGLPKINQPIFDTTQPTFITKGTPGIFAAWMVMHNCCISAMGTVYQGRNAANARRDIPRGMLLTQLICFFLYMGCGIVAIGVVPQEQVAGTLVNVAKAIFPAWFYPIWVIVIPGLLVLTTLNGLMSQFTMQLYQLSVDGWMPEILKKENKHGSKWVVLTILWVVALIPILLGWNINAVLSQITFCTLFSDMLILISLFMLPKVFPNGWKARMGWCPMWLYYVVCLLSITVRGAVAYSAVTNITGQKLLVTLAIMAVIIIWVVFRNKSGKARIRISCWDLESDSAET